MGLAEIKNRQWSIQETSAIKGQGMFEGFDWYVTVTDVTQHITLTDTRAAMLVHRLVTCIKGGE
jgi:hypothetical protein